jgi:large subunit ribosomal protein L29
MKMKELSELAMDELLTKRRDLRQESLHLRLQQQSGQLEQPSRLRLLRRDLARIETELLHHQHLRRVRRRLVRGARRAQAKCFPAA